MRPYYGWIVIGVGLVVQAICWGIALSAFTFWAKPWAEEFAAPMSAIMAVTMFMQYGMGLMAPFAGRQLDHRSIRLLICAGAIILGLGLALASRATALWQISAIYGIVIALGAVLTGPLPVTTLAVKWFRSRRGLAIGLAATGPSFGGLLVPPLVVELIAALGWRDAHLVLALLAPALVVPLVYFLVRNTPEAKGVEPEPDLPLEAGAVLPPAMPILTTGQILGSRAFWALNIAFVPVLIAFNGFGFNLAPFAADAGISGREVAQVVMLLSAMAIVGCITFGGLADRVDHRLLFAGMVGGVALGILVIALAPSFLAMMVLAPLVGFASGGVLPLLSAVCATRFGPASFGAAMGLLGPFITLSAAGAPLAGLGRDMFGDYQTVFLTMLAAMLPFTLAILVLKPPRAQPVAPLSPAEAAPLVGALPAAAPPSP